MIALKVVRAVCIVVAVVFAVLTFGLAGGLETDVLTLAQCAIRLPIFLCIAGICLLIAHAVNESLFDYEEDWSEFL